jgi:hypothetical protein
MSSVWILCALLCLGVESDDSRDVLAMRVVEVLRRKSQDYYDASRIVQDAWLAVVTQ